MVTWDEMLVREFAGWGRERVRGAVVAEGLCGFGAEDLLSRL
jgi:hypothetical protein